MEPRGSYQGVLLVISFCLLAGEARAQPGGDPALDELPRKKPTADHRRFDALNKDFNSGPEVTRACLSCHTEAAKQVMQTSHWTWICPRAKAELASRQKRAVGKGEHVINNFCIALGSNEPRCTSCHAGYGWKDNSFDFNDEAGVDCLICHDTTRTYRKFPTAAGHPNYAPQEWPKGSGTIWPAPDLGRVARNVGKPSRHNCGACHFFGGGGEGVKHGDMDVTLDRPGREVDVHMNEKGADFSCTQCHTTVNHRVSGRCFTIPAYDQRRYVLRGIRKNLLACESCHGKAPHAAKPKLNDHTDKVSCQACHVPYIAPNKPTKMWWDWSRAGRRDSQGQPIARTADLWPGGEAGPGAEPAKVLAYHGQKGAFVWAQRAVPEYTWFNGRVKHTFIGDRLDDATPGSATGATRGRHDRLDLSKPVVKINDLRGGYTDPGSRIWPVKVHRGIQPYDPVKKVFVVPKLFPSGQDKDKAYWKSYDWDGAIVAGMNYVKHPYSGKYGWIQTMMYWPLSHMVAPREQALQCTDCHSRKGRLAALGGFYMPGRDHSPTLDWLGLLLILGALAGATVHGALRVVAHRRRGR
jgi:octaheme c-type cytochrome (tetrathionate reductase family)